MRLCPATVVYVAHGGGVSAMSFGDVVGLLGSPQDWGSDYSVCTNYDEARNDADYQVRLKKLMVKLSDLVKQVMVAGTIINSADVQAMLAECNDA